MVQMLFSQIQQAPGPDFRKVGKSMHGYLMVDAADLSSGLNIYVPTCRIYKVLVKSTINDFRISCELC